MTVKQLHDHRQVHFHSDGQGVRALSVPRVSLLYDMRYLAYGPVRYSFTERLLYFNCRFVSILVHISSIC